MTVRLRNGVRKLGILAEVNSRPKEVDSLVKKLLLKPEHTYDSLPDKVGVRITIKFRSDIEAVQALITSEFDHETPDDKARAMGVSQVGYLSVHLDRTRLKVGDSQIEEFPPSKFFAEVQLRTQAQHLWSEMSHDDVYKNNETYMVLSDDLRRRVNLMAGQVEVVDREFDRINKEIPKDDAYRLLKSMEKNYFKLTAHRPNPELSFAVIRLLLPTFENKPPESAISFPKRSAQ